mgnify:CR=1 FL=1
MELTEILYYVAILFQIITLFVITFRYKYYKSRFSFYFLCFIYVTVLVELIGLYYLKVIEEYSFEVYNIYTFLEFNLVTLMYLSLIKERKTIHLIKFLNVIFNVIYIVSFIYKPLQSYTITILSLVVSVFFIAYLRELLTSDKILNYKRHLPFWITAGFIIFYLSSVPFQFIRESLTNRNLFSVQMIIIYIMHSCFIFGLLWSKEET